MTEMKASPNRLAVLKTRRDYLAIAGARQSCGAAGLVLQSAEASCLKVRPGPEKGCQPTEMHVSGQENGGQENRGQENGRQESGHEIQVGFTASKKVGGAVRRNRAKRRLRALSKEILAQEALPSHSYVLIARHSTPERPWEKLRADLRYCLKKLGLKRKIHSRGFEGKASGLSGRE